MIEMHHPNENTPKKLSRIIGVQVYAGVVYLCSSPLLAPCYF